jgi:cytoskeletal protein CcmA (bactofilin family)
VIGADMTGPHPVNNGFGKLLIQNREGDTVAFIDETGNAEFSGQVSSDSLDVAGDATVAGELHADRIYVNEIVGLDAKFADIAANTYSGLTREEIEEMLKQAESDQDLLNNASDWEITNGSGSASLNEMLLENLYVTGTAAITSLSVSESIVLGNDLVISSPTGPEALRAGGQQLTSIDTVSAPLSIQSSASQPLYLMAGMVKIDIFGNVDIAGSLAVQGSIKTKSLTLTADSEHTTESGKLLSVIDSLGDEVAGISATGSAEFKEVTTDTLIVREDPTATSSAGLAGTVYINSSTAGTASVPKGETEITLQNPNIKQNSLLFITATSQTQANLYIKSQSEGVAVIGFSTPAINDANFNWWIVSVAN